MTLMIKILSVLGLILLAAVLLLVWVIIMPRHFWLEYCKADGLVAKMNIGPFKMRLYPLPDFLAKKKRANPRQNNHSLQKLIHNRIVIVNQILLTMYSFQ